MSGLANFSDDPLALALVLWRVKGIGPKHFARIRSRYPDLAEFLSLSPVQWQQMGCNELIIKGLKSLDWSGVERDLHFQQQHNQHIIIIDDVQYPPQLAQIADAPPILFVCGDVACLAARQIAMVGARNATTPALDLAARFARQLVSHALGVTSGLALGIDGASHRGALSIADARGKTIAVLAAGLDHIYPHRHRQLALDIAENGALLSEFPTGVKALAKHFPRRNRIISGLSQGVLVVEAAIRSGSLITAHYALEQGRDVFAVPGSVNNPLAKGCHYLLRDGAKLTESIEDILDELPECPRVAFAQKTAKCVKLPMDKAQQAIISCMGYEVTAVDALVTRTGLAANEVFAQLSCLELSGHVRAVAGGYLRL